jgi:hypothetical protein
MLVVKTWLIFTFPTETGFQDSNRLYSQIISKQISTAFVSRNTASRVSCVLGFLSHQKQRSCPRLPEDPRRSIIQNPSWIQSIVIVPFQQSFITEVIIMPPCAKSHDLYVQVGIPPKRRFAACFLCITKIKPQTPPNINLPIKCDVTQ